MPFPAAKGIVTLPWAVGTFNDWRAALIVVSLLMVTKAWPPGALFSTRNSILINTPVDVSLFAPCQKSIKGLLPKFSALGSWKLSPDKAGPCVIALTLSIRKFVASYPIRSLIAAMPGFVSKVMGTVTRSPWAAATWPTVMVAVPAA